jgi:septum formation protein
MAETSLPLVLASQSPRRREILKRLGIQFVVKASTIDESQIEAAPPEGFVISAASAKSREVAAAQEEPSFVLGSDTIVAVDAEVLGKPLNDDEARVMLTQLSGVWHEVWTGVCVTRTPQMESCAIAICTRVRFRQLTDAEINGYVRTQEGRDKAGSYGIQGIGGGLVDRIDGSYDNVVGLPSSDCVDLLRRVGCLMSWP